MEEEAQIAEILPESVEVAVPEKKVRRHIDHQQRIAKSAEKHMSAVVDRVAMKFWESVEKKIEGGSEKILARTGNWLGYDKQGGGMSININQQNNASPLAGKSFESMVRELELRDAARKTTTVDAEFTDG